MNIFDLKKLPVYLSGPITGLPVDQVIDAFDNAFDALRRNGLRGSVFDPFFECDCLNEKRWIYCLAICLDQIAMYNGKAIFCRLPGWQNSAGCRIENYYARQRGLVICDLVGNTLKLADDYLGGER